MSKVGRRKRLSFAVRAIVTLTIVAAALPLMSGVATAATGPVTVSLTFDDTLASQYSLGYTYALQPHNIRATFFVNSGLVNSGGSKMTWSQLSTMANAGNEISGKTVDGADLTALSSSAATAEVCNDRQALINHGLGIPDSFAYPLGRFNDSVEGIVAGCGYGSARKGGGLGLNAPSQSNPPANYYETGVYSPTGRMSLANLQSLVTNAFNKGGGWSQVLLQRVCDQGIDPGGYASCQAGIWIQLADLNAFLNWIQAAGQPGGAPAGTTMATVGATLTGSDVTPPVTSISCNSAPCSNAPYTGGNVSVALSATDSGSGVAGTHYTVDGSPPTLTSPTYTGAFLLSTGTTTVNYRSWDKRGNVEAIKTQVVEVQLGFDTTPPATTILCNGQACTSTNYAGGLTVSLSATDGSGGSGVDTTYYTLDGTDPTTSSTIYKGSFMLAGNTTVKFFSTDLAGNAEAIRTQQLLMTPYPVVVSLTYDDQYANQYLYLRPLLLSHNMRATIYVITSDTNLGHQCCMTWAQLDTMANEGNDIGGHGVNHLNLTDPNIPFDQKVADVCGSYTDLINHGIPNPASFAYPFGAWDSTAESIVRNCGYVSSRTGGGISSSNNSPGPPWTEMVPPADRYAIKAIDVDGSSPKVLTDMQNYVMAAAIHGGGWLPMVFHQVCHQGASDYAQCMSTWGAVDETVMAQFLDWLGNAGQNGAAPAGTVVKTVAQTIGIDFTAPATTASLSPASNPAGWNTTPVTVTLSATDAGGSGVAATYYTTDGSDPRTNGTTYVGPFAVGQTATVRFYSVDGAGNAEAVKSQAVQIDTVAPVTTSSCNGQSCSSWFTSSPVTVTLSATDSGGSGLAATYYTTDGSDPTQGGTPYTGPFAVAQTTTVRVVSVDTAGNTEAVKSQTVQIDVDGPITTASLSPASNPAGWNTTPVTVTLSATDAGGSGVAATYYTTDGSDPRTNGTSYTVPFTVTQSANVRFYSVDEAGNAETVQTDAIQIDMSAPVTTSTCNGQSCSSSWFATSVTVSLSAIDSGGSGLVATYYTTDGTDPTAGGAPYVGPFTVDQTTTVRFVSVDTAGNTEAVKSQTIGIDFTAPATTASLSPASNPAGWNTTPVTVTLSATDAGGSGVAATYYTTDGSDPRTNGTTYVGPFAVGQTATVRFYSVDGAGNAEAVKSQAVQIDTVAPVTTSSCNGQSCSSWFTSSPVTVTLSATDSGGSGLAATYYTTDGSDPTQGGTPYTGPFAVAQTTTVRVVSVDTAGNTEAVKSQTVQIDVDGPITTASLSPASNPAGWNTTPVTVTLSATDAGGSGVAAVTYSLSGAQTRGATTYTGGFQITAQGATTVSYFATDVAGNVESTKSLTVRIDATNPTQSIALTKQIGSGSYLSGSTLYYRGSVAGSFALSDAMVDGGAGPASATFGALGGSSAGWTHAAPDVQTTPAGGPFVSGTFSWAANTVSSPTENVTGADTAGNTVLTALAFTPDITAPTGGSISAPAFVKGPSVTITFSAGADMGSGLNAATGQLLRASAVYNETLDSCGTFGSFANVGPANPSSPFTDTAVSGGTCYRYEYTISDNVGNVAAYGPTAPAKVDLTAPSVTAVVSQQPNGSAGDGRLQVGDKLVITFNDRLNPATVPTSGTSGSEARSGKANVLLSISGITNGPLDTGSSDYLAGNGSKTASFSWTAAWSNNNTVLTVTVTALSGAVTAASSGKLLFSPATTMADPAGNGATGTFGTPATFKLF